MLKNHFDNLNLRKLKKEYISILKEYNNYLNSLNIMNNESKNIIIKINQKIKSISEELTIEKQILHIYNKLF